MPVSVAGFKLAACTYVPSIFIKRIHCTHCGNKRVPVPVGFEPRQEKVPLAPKHILRVISWWHEWATKLMIWAIRNRQEEPSTKVGYAFII